jgi:predicted ester cyclase
MEGVVGGTAKTLSGFPDRTLVGDAVIWSGDETEGYYSSHRITSQATNLGQSEFGPATGKKVSFITIADCLCLRNRIVEEWLVRDNASIALQLGFSPRAIARAQAAGDRALSDKPQQWRMEELERVRCQPETVFPGLKAPDAASEPEAFSAWYFDTIWHHRRFTAARNVYSPAAAWDGPSGRSLFGWGEIIGWLNGLLASFPDARFSLDHVASVHDVEWTDIAVRWSMAGTHNGTGLYGPASGQTVYILAITHWRVSGGRIVAEQTVMDDIAVLRQMEGGL